MLQFGWKNSRKYTHCVLRCLFRKWPELAILRWLKEDLVNKTIHLFLFFSQKREGQTDRWTDHRCICCLCSPAPFFNCLTLSTNFGQPRTGPVCRFCYCFLDICIRTIQQKDEGWGACFWTTASQDIFVGFYPLTILSAQGHISELVVQTGKKQCHWAYCTNAYAHFSNVRWHKDSKQAISMLPVWPRTFLQANC